MGSPDVDFGAIKKRQQAVWASGDYAEIATLIVPISEQLCEAAGLRAGQRVLDVACGSGNAVLAAARRGCEVTGLDYVPGLLDRARERLATERLSAELVEGDAEQLPFGDQSYDAVISVVGVMFAPDQERSAAELTRVCRTGGTIALASWTPDGFIGDLFRHVGNFVPPPPGVKPPAMWGNPDRLSELFGDVHALRTRRHTFTFNMRTAEEFADLFISRYGPTLKAYESLDEEGRDAFRRGFVELIERYDDEREGSVAVGADWLEAIVTP